MSSTNGRSSANERGSSYDRRARKQWLVSPAAGYGGDGVKVGCWECGVMLSADELIPDRIVPGELGGTYRRANIRPQCPLCSCRSGQRRTEQLKATSGKRGPFHDNEGVYWGPMTTNTAWPPLDYPCRLGW